MVITNKQTREFFERYLDNEPIKKVEVVIPLNLITKKDRKYSRLGRIKRKNSCYFCGFDIVIQKHHIVGRSAGGNDSYINLLVLCPNHHWMLHHARYSLRWWDGYLFLVNLKDLTDITLPHPMHYGHKREYPETPFYITRGKMVVALYDKLYIKK